MKKFLTRAVLTTVALAAIHGSGWTQASNVIFPTNYPYTQTNLLTMDVIKSTNGVLEASVNMFTAGTNSAPITYGTDLVYTGTGSSNVTTSGTNSSTNEGMYAMAYQFNDYASGRSYQTGFPGTMLQIRPGDTLKLHVYNWLANSSTNNDPNDPVFISNFHYHGSHAPDLSQGDNVYIEHKVGEVNQSIFPISQYENSVGLNWYHPHQHEVSKTQVQGGLAGLIMVGDPLDPWPLYKGKFKEVNMAFTEVNLQTNSSGKFQFFQIQTGDKYGPNYTQGWQKRINGQMNPIITIAPGETQIWNWCMASARGAIMPVIADANLSNAWSNCTILSRDGNSAFVHPYVGTLSNSAVRMQDISSQALLGTGNRTTWAITAPTNPGTYYLMDGWGGEESPNNAGGTNYFYVLATINVTGTNVTTPAPFFFPQPPDALWSAKPDVYRTFTLEQQFFSYYDPQYGTNIDNFYINGYKFGYGPMPQLEIGKIEEWTIVNGGPLNHPFHIHQGNFVVTKVGGVDINPNYPPIPDFLARNYVSPQDVIMVPAYSSVTVRFRVQNFPGKYVWHCHILEHEDEGMMSPVFQFPNRNGIRLALSGAIPASLVIDGNGNVVNTIKPIASTAWQSEVTASGIGTDETTPQLTNIPTSPNQANAAYAAAVVQQTLAVGASTGSSLVQVYANGSKIPTCSFKAFSNNAGVSLAVGALSTNGAVRIAVGSRAKGPADVRIFDQRGKLLNEYKGMLPGIFPNGVNVAVSDANHDNFDDLVISAATGREPLITALDGKDIATNSTNPNTLFTVLAGDPTSKEGLKIAAGYVAPATVPSYYPNLITTAETGLNVGSVQVWNLADLAGIGTMSGMPSGTNTPSTSSSDTPVMPMAEYRPFGSAPGPVNITTTYQSLPYGQPQPVIAAWQKGRQAAFTIMGLDNVPVTQKRNW